MIRRPRLHLACVLASIGLASTGPASPASAQTPYTLRASVSSSGAQANSTSFSPRISADGHYVVFSSYAGNLVPGDTGFFSDIFVRDLRTGTTTRVSVDSNGAQSNGDSYLPVISANGRYVAFESIASNLVPGDTNDKLDVFLHDRTTGATTRVSVDSSGVQGNDHSLVAAISGDGSVVAFASAASNLVPGDTNGLYDVFVHDVPTGITTRASVTSSGLEASGPSQNPSLSYDGRFVAFESTAPNFVAGDANGVSDVFLHDNATGTTVCVSVDSNGVPGNGDSAFAWISGNSRYVSFSSTADDLVANDLNQVRDVFVRDRISGTTALVSVSSSGQQGDQDSIDSSISFNGHWIAFDSNAANLVGGDTNGATDVFLRDTATGVTTRQSLSTSGSQADFTATNPVLSADGRFIAFQSGADDLVAGDTNVMVDAFVRDLEATAFSSLCDPGAAGVIACPCANAPSGPDRGCDNSAGTGGANLAASGIGYLSADSVVFMTSGEKPTATSILLQGTTGPSSGIVYGQGVRCVSGNLKRLFVKTAAGGSITAPDFGAGDPTVSARSAAKGDVIQSGQSRWYLVYYRDPTVLGGCPASSTFNATQTGRVDWSL